jgi:hypothetical protein
LDECPKSQTKKENKMKKETFDWMVLKSKRIITQWQQTATINLKLKQNFGPKGMVSPGSEVIGPHHCDEEMRERYRI